MRKNYFAKKLIAYSMAFAVAFSTLTVSPVFVKEAKAASITLSDSDSNVVLDDGIALISSVKSSATTPAPLTLTNVKTGIGMEDKAFYLGTGKFTIADDVITGNNSGDGKLVSAKKLTISGGLEDITSATSTGANTKYVVRDEEQENFKLEGTAGTGTHEWFKLRAAQQTFTAGITTAPETITVDYYIVSSVGQGVTKELDAVTDDELGFYIHVTNNSGAYSYEIFNVVEESELDVEAERTQFYAKEGEAVKLTVNATSNKTDLTYKWKYGSKELDCDSNVYEIASLDKNTKGDYTCIVSDGVRTQTVTPINVAYATVGAKGVNYNSVVKALKTDDTNKLSGETVTLTSSVAKNDDYVFIWSVKDATPAAVALEDVMDTNDVLAYDAANNSIKLTSKDGTFSEAQCDVYYASEYTEFTNSSKKVSKLMVALDKATSDVEKYNIKKALLNLTVTGGATPLYTEKFEFVKTDVVNTIEEDIAKKVNDSLKMTAPSVKAKAAILPAVSNSNTGRTAGKLSYELKKFASDGTLGAALSDKSEYNLTNLYASDFGSYQYTTTETYNVLAPASDDDTKDGITSAKKFVDENFEDITAAIEATTSVAGCTDKTVKAYLNKEDSNGNKINEGKKVYIQTVAPVTDVTTKIINVVYTPDLKVTANDVVAKIGDKITLSVEATSVLPLKYTWTGKNSFTAITKDIKDNSKTSEFTVGNNDIYIPAEYDENGDIVSNTGVNYAECTVTNGIETKTVAIKVSQKGGFSYIDSTGKSKMSYIKTSDIFNVNAIANKDITLAPVATPNEGTELVYKWYKGTTPSGDPISTDAALNVKWDGSTNYVVVIADKDALDNQVKLEYHITTLSLTGKTVSIANIAPVKYTGTAIEPKITLLITSGSTTSAFVGELTNGTDYFVTYENNINVGIARVNVTFNEKIDPTQDAKAQATFAIDRADNEVTVADKTIVLGGSVQPKTTNKAGAAVTYTYYADADCTTEIDVPSKVGTYYVKANAIATVNYNEATSNVATVKVVPGKVKMLGTSRTASSVKLNWNKTTGATSYRVFYKAAGAKSYKVFKNTTATSMNVTGLASATTYTFAVKAYAKNAGYSTVYATKQTTTAPAKAAKPTVTAGSKKATVKFTKVARATGYEVYMAKGNGSYKKVATTKSLSFTKTGLAKGATYKFKVRAYKTVGSNTYYGAFSSAKAVVVK